MNGHWTFIWVGGLIVAGFLLLKRLQLISTGSARKHLKQGARVVDVRSAEEFRAGHLPGALNLPLGELSEDAPRRVPDRQQILLLHCLSGTRSGIARRQLKGMGYTKVFNLGSYRRAEHIVRT